VRPVRTTAARPARKATVRATSTRTKALARAR
jgi:hypothetical protein